MQLHDMHLHDSNCWHMTIVYAPCLASARACIMLFLADFSFFLQVLMLQTKVTLLEEQLEEFKRQNKLQLADMQIAFLSQQSKVCYPSPVTVTSVCCHSPHACKHLNNCNTAVHCKRAWIKAIIAACLQSELVYAFVCEPCKASRPLYVSEACCIHALA